MHTYPIRVRRARVESGLSRLVVSRSQLRSSDPRAVPPVNARELPDTEEVRARRYVTGHEWQVVINREIYTTPHRIARTFLISIADAMYDGELPPVAAVPPGNPAIIEYRLQLLLVTICSCVLRRSTERTIESQTNSTASE